MPTANARKGAVTERMVADYLRRQGYCKADRRLREGRQDDQGDIDGVPFTTIQVKYVARPALQAWVTATLKQRDTAGTPLCLLIVRVKGKPVAQWDAYMPSSYFLATFEDMDGVAVGDYFAESEAWTWVRMDLRLATAALKRMTVVLSSLSSLRGTSTDSIRTPHGTSAWSSALSTENESPRSRTT